MASSDQSANGQQGNAGNQGGAQPPMYAPQTGNMPAPPLPDPEQPPVIGGMPAPPPGMADTAEHENVPNTVHLPPVPPSPPLGSDSSPLGAATPDATFTVLDTSGAAAATPKRPPVGPPPQPGAGPPAPRVDIGSPDAAQKAGGDADSQQDKSELVDSLLKTISGLQESIKLMNQQMLEMQASMNAQVNSAGQWSAKGPNDLPYVNSKDVDKPSKFGGSKWQAWEEDFKHFLTRRDRRWKEVLNTIQSLSDKPLDDTGLEKIRKAAGMNSKEVEDAFKAQLYEHLKSCTSGDINTAVVAGTPEKSFETWRRLCDQGRSIRERPLRDERRALFHPKQATLETVVEAIASWEKRLNDYVNLRRGAAMADDDRVMCLEDICPEVLQRYLSDKRQNGHIRTYDQYKDAIDNYFYEERRWTRKAKINAVAAAQAEEFPDESEDATEDTGVWMESLMGEINALVQNKFKGKGKGKSKGKPGGASSTKNAAAPMDVDGTGSAGSKRPGKGKGNGKGCYECGDEDHYGRDCPIRLERIARGGPAIIPKGKNNTGGPPTAAAWKQMYPGPSPTQWSAWRPANASPGNVKANLFQSPQVLSSLQAQPQFAAPPLAAMQAPQQLHALQSLLSPGGAYSIVPRKKSASKKEVLPSERQWQDHNPFSALAEAPAENTNATEIAIQDLIKPPSKNALRRQRRREARGSNDCAPPPPEPEQVAPRERARQRPRSSAICGGFARSPGGPCAPQACSSTIGDCCGGEDKTNATLSAEDAARAEREWEAMKCNSVEVRAELKRRRDAEKQAFLDARSGPRTEQSVGGATTNTNDANDDQRVEFSNGSKGCIELCHSCDSLVIAERHQICPACGTKGALSTADREAALRAGATEEHADVLEFLRLGVQGGETKESLKQVMSLNVFNPKVEKHGLNVMGDNAETLRVSKPAAVTHARWEQILAIVDSGATVPVLHPKVGKSYPVEESEASRLGLEYEIADGSPLPNLGQKAMAVLTAEGALRGYRSQCADVSKTLQSVRALVSSHHAVCFGLGPEGNDHIIVNKLTGEINRMEDDGINYLQRLWVIPPEEVDAVQQQIDHSNGSGNESGFARPGR